MKRLLTIIICVSLFACAGTAPNSAPTVADGASIQIPGAPHSGDGGKSYTGEETGSAGGSYQATGSSTPGKNDADEDWVEAPWMGHGGAGADDALPQASLPTPTLLKTLAYTPDANALNPAIPYVGQAGSADPGPAGNKNRLLVRLEETHAEANLLSSPSLKSFWQLILPSAQAQTPVLHPCDQPGNFCFPINPDGSFEAYVPVTGSQEFIFSALVNEQGQLSATVAEPVQEALLWLKNKPKDLAAIKIAASFAGGSQGEENILYALTHDVGVRLEETQDGLRTLGQPAEAYRDFFAQGAESLSVEPQSGALALRRPAEGIELRAPAAEGFADSGLLVSDPEKIKSYEVLKRTASGELRMGVEGLTNNRGRIFKILSDSLVPTEPIEFIQPTDSLSHKKTLAFDVVEIVAGYQCALVAYEDLDGAAFLRVGCDHPSINDEKKDVRFGQTPLQSKSVRDLAILGLTFSGLQYSVEALVLDAEKMNVWAIEFKDANLDDDIPGMLTTTLDPKTLSIPTGSDPVAMTLNPEKSRAYIANRGNDTLTVLELKKDGLALSIAQIRASAKTIKLGDFLSKPGLSLKPSSLAYHRGKSGDMLVVGSEALKAVLVIPVN